VHALKSDLPKDWRLVHILASITAAALLIAIGLNLFVTTHYLTERQFPSQIDLRSIPLRVVAVASAFAVIWFWFKMLSHYYRAAPKKHPFAWAVALILGLYFGALAYFWFVWRPSHAQAQQSAA
jgi:hypothetical protein